MLGRVFMVAALVAIAALVLRLLQLGASLLLLVVAVISGLVALVLGALMLMQRRADRDAATR
jgi:hypothetical protein